MIVKKSVLCTSLHLSTVVFIMLGKMLPIFIIDKAVIIITVEKIV